VIRRCNVGRLLTLLALLTLLTLLACSTILIGAEAPGPGYPFQARGDSLCAVGTEEALRQAVIEYTSAMLEHPGDGRPIARRALVYADLGSYRTAIHDADTALMYGSDELYYYYVVGKSRPSIECLRRAFSRACTRGDRTLIPAVGKLLLHYETRYRYVTEEDIYP
jgi:hypothetical protein